MFYLLLFGWLLTLFAPLANSSAIVWTLDPDSKIIQLNADIFKERIAKGLW